MVSLWDFFVALLVMPTMWTVEGPLWAFVAGTGTAIWLAVLLYRNCVVNFVRQEL